MRLAVASYQTCPVNGKHDRKLLQTYIVDDLIKSPLQER